MTRSRHPCIKITPLASLRCLRCGIQFGVYPPMLIEWLRVGGDLHCPRGHANRPPRLSSVDPELVLDSEIRGLRREMLRDEIDVLEEVFHQTA